jgi:sterol 24-C-methyltransferase
MKSINICAAIIVAWFASSFVLNNNHWVSFYQVKAAIVGVKQLFALSEEDIKGCVEAYKYLQAGTSDLEDANSDSAVETEHVRKYYKVLQPLLSIADIEKMYIPPQLDPKQGLYGNQLIHEKQLIDQVKVDSNSHILDIGCGAGRIAHYAATLTGGKVSGFNIDAKQIENAKNYAIETGYEDKLDYKVGDHHNRFQYDDNTFDGSYSFQALWPFIKLSQLDNVSKEIYRVMKPGSYYVCGEYLLTPDFDKTNEEHMRLHKLFLPTLAATQSNYPKDVTDSLERAGFKLILSAPSKAPAWPLTDQKTDLFLTMRKMIIFLNKIGLLPEWTEKLVSNLLLGGIAWADAEKAKIADLNWQIIVQKPFE